MMKNLIIEAFSQMTKENMNKVKMEDFKYVSYFLIKIAEQYDISNNYYDYRGYGYDMNYEQNIRPLVDELEECGYVY